MLDKIASVQTALDVGVPIEDIRTSLLEQGMTEYDIFLTVKAAEVSIRMSERFFPVELDIPFSDISS